MSGIRRLEEWKARSPHHAFSTDYVGSSFFVRLMVPHRWSISQKDFPTNWINGEQKEDIISAIGYGDTLDDAIDAAFFMLPG